MARFAPNDSFSTKMFDLSAISGESQVYIALWLDVGEGEYAKIDNVMVLGGQQVIVPVPVVVWLLGSALLGLFGLRRCQ